MNCCFEQTYPELLSEIKAADDSLSRINVCAIAYPLIQSMEPPQQTGFLQWFLETADSFWFPARPPQKPDDDDDDDIKDILDLLGSDEPLTSTDMAPMYDSPGARPAKEPVSCLDRGALPPRPGTKPVTASDAVSCRAKFSRSVTGIIDRYSNEDQSPEWYYQKLWQELEAMLSQHSAVEKAVCLYLVLLDKRTPYWQTKRGIRMSNEKYQEITDSLIPALQRMRFALSLSNGQRTETASQILFILDELESFEERTVFLSQLLAEVEPDE